MIGVLRLSDDLIGKSVLRSKIASVLGILVKSLSGQRESGYVVCIFVNFIPAAMCSQSCLKDKEYIWNMIEMKHSADV